MSKWIALLFLAAVLAAQEEQSIIRVNTRLVELDVVVRDKHGPVADLTQDDFTVLDQGKPQKIASFTVISAHSPKEPSIPLRPGEVSNRVNSLGQEPTGTTAVLLGGGAQTRIPTESGLRTPAGNEKYLASANPRKSNWRCIRGGAKAACGSDFTKMIRKFFAKVVSAYYSAAGRGSERGPIGGEILAALSGNTGDPDHQRLWRRTPLKSFRIEALKNQASI